MTARIAIVDYGLGNLFNVKRACEHVGLTAEITSSREAIDGADAVLLPGVGAFGAAMENLRRLSLVEPLRALAESDRPLVGICLGIQLLMSESYEFGHHQGLGIVPGTVERLRDAGPEGRIRVPHVGWAPIISSEGRSEWANPLLESVDYGEYMYFVHSYVVRPRDPSVITSVTTYGIDDFCSSLRWRNVFAFQFHPERSGRAGLQVYANLARLIGVPG